MSGNIKEHKQFSLKNIGIRDQLVVENVLENFDPVIPESYKQAEYVMLGNLVPAIQSQVLDNLGDKPKFTMLDTMNLWMDVAMDDLKKVIARWRQYRVSKKEGNFNHNLVVLVVQIYKQQLVVMVVMVVVAVTQE